MSDLPEEVNDISHSREPSPHSTTITHGNACAEKNEQMHL
jgi:hypothetical protein